MSRSRRDGRLLAATGVDGRIALWSIPSLGPAGTIRHPDGAPAIAVSPDGRMLLSGGYDRVARIWNLADRRLLRQLRGHEGTIWSVAWSPDGRLLATAGEDRTIRIWRAADGLPLHVLRGHELNIWVVRFSPDSRLLASGSFDHSIRLWNAETGALVRRLARPRRGGGQPGLQPRRPNARQRRRRFDRSALARRGRRAAAGADRRLRACLRDRVQSRRALAGERRPSAKRDRHFVAPAHRRGAARAMR